MQTSEVLNKAADLIQQRGWATASGWHPQPGSTSPLCLEGALRAAFGYRAIKGGACPAYDAVRDYLTDSRPERINPFAGYVVPWAWNDDRNRTADEVIEVLRATAVIEASRECEAAEVSA